MEWKDIYIPNYDFSTSTWYIFSSTIFSSLSITVVVFVHDYCFRRRFCPRPLSPSLSIIITVFVTDYRLRLCPPPSPFLSTPLSPSSSTTTISVAVSLYCRLCPQSPSLFLSITTIFISTIHHHLVHYH